MIQIKTDTWRTIAIVFIVLFALETIFMVKSISLGNEMIRKDNECAINICRDYDVYYYEEYEEMCYCYEDEEIIYQELMR